MKASDTQAASIQWGIELETRIPDTAGVSVGGYHNGLPVRVGMDQANGLPHTSFAACACLPLWSLPP